MSNDHPFRFTAHHLRFEVETLTPLELPPYPGGPIRAALFDALQRHFCPLRREERASPEHKAMCPVCWLMAGERPERGRGRDVPRPYTVEPPVSGAPAPPVWRFEPGGRFAFGLTLFAHALNLFPYLVVAMPLMGQAGLGLPLAENARRDGRPRRGRFALCRIDAVNPLTGETAAVLGEDQTLVRTPDVPVVEGDVAAAAAWLLAQVASDGRVQLRFWTPTRIVDEGRLAHRPWLGPIARRLLERLDALRGEYAGEGPVPDRERLLALADAVRLVQDRTRWVELQSGSQRLGRATPIGGFVGAAVYEADAETWRALLPVLLWGQAVHVGKDATKGNGWYEVCLSSNT